MLEELDMTSPTRFVRADDISAATHHALDETSYGSAISPKWIGFALILFVFTVFKL